MPIEDFLRLPEEKQDEIMLTALREFAHKGYDLASTNSIVAEAGISKGLLFKFFGSKEKLFLYLVQRYLHKTVSLVRLDENVTDMFAYMLAKFQAENALFKDNSDALLSYLLLNKMMNTPDHPIYKKARALYYDSYVKTEIDRIMSRLDVGRLRDGLTPAAVREVIELLINSFRALAHQDPETFLLGWPARFEKEKQMLEIVKRGIYR
jgi:TetR/AcrR family transcriptional regulator